jgi:hypothetical protein
MNRIILIGNGFDLAHKLETTYRSFIDDLWETKLKNFQKKSDYQDDDFEIKGLENYPLALLPCDVKKYKDLKDFKSFNASRLLKLTYKNTFFKIISEASLINWVDVENEYFDYLISIIKSDSRDKIRIRKLNKDFSSIKILLEKYISNELKKKQESLIRYDEIFNKMYSHFHIEDFSKVGLKSFIEEVTFELNSIITEMNNKNKTYNSRNHEDIFEYVTKKDHLEKYYLDNEKLNKLMSTPDQAARYLDFSPSNCLLLNFNYTNTELKYSSFQNYYSYENHPIVKINHIHGELNSKTNPIIFGYGDEIGKDYAVIEEVNDNDLLENVKSIRYLDTDNYKKMLEYIDSDKYQIFIMGHSCGNSDRTLLNTLFEHKNCVSIKVFYHQINENEDNYSDVIRNISRNFNDKKMMREKVVNKKYCSPLVKM